MTGKKLARHVTVEGVTYGPNDDVPAEVMDKIKNPKAWQTVDDQMAADAEDAERKAKAGTTSGARLATSVNVAGRTYRPEDHIPDDIAAQIKNPKAWEGGKLPGAEGSGDDQGQGDGGRTPAKSRPVKATAKTTPAKAATPPAE